jgi:hypothetical protein
MTAATKLSLLAALAIVALATTSAPALATTITSNGSPYSGPIEGDEDGWPYFYNGSIGGNCNDSNLSGAIEPDGTGQITSWTFENCTHGTGPSFDVFVKGLPYDFQVEHTTGNEGTLTITSPVSMQFNGGYFGGCTMATGGWMSAPPTQARVFGSSPHQPAQMNFQGVLDRRVSGNCNTGFYTWHAEYQITAPADLHIEP